MRWWLPWIGVALGVISLVLPTRGARALAQEIPARELSTQNKFEDIEDLSLEKLLESEITIAAGRTQSLAEAPGIVSSISADDIRRFGMRTLADVLKIVPGFEVLTDRLGRDRIIVRGLIASGSENVLILFNGHRLNEVVTGGATAVNLDIFVDNLERIEIIRGPGSALFGTNAFAAVINLVPYTADSFEGSRVSVGGGSFDTQHYNLLTGHTLGDVKLSGFAQYRHTNGAERTVAADFQSTQPLFPEISRAPGPTDDERRAVDVNAQLAYKGLSLNSRFKDERSGGFIGFTNRLSDSTLETQQLALDARYHYAFGQRGNVRATFSFTQNKSRQRLELLPPGGIVVLPHPDGVVIDFDVNSRRFEGEVILDYRLFDQHHMTVGISFANESTYNLRAQGNFEDLPFLRPRQGFRTLPFNLIKDSSRDIFSVMLQDIWKPLPDLDITAGVRYDRFSDFGETVDPRLGIVWRFADNLYLKLLYGSAFRAPSFFEFFYEATTGLEGTNFLPNPDLKPTRLHAFELAVGYTHPQVRLSANYFLTLVRDFIGLEPTASDAAGQSIFANSLDLDIQGVEVEVQANVKNHLFFLNYTYQYAKNKITGDRLADVPSHLANLGASVRLGPYVQLAPTLLIRGNRPRAETDIRDDSPAYAVLNMTVLVHRFFRTLELSATVRNMLNTRYEDPAPVATVPGDYPRPGREVFIKATYQF